MSVEKTPTSWANSTFVHVAFGFVAMGAWAVFANRDHPLSQALLAGLVQGIISGSLTLVLKKSLERMSALFFGARASDAGIAKPSAALIVPPLITAASILAILVGVHTLAGTPEIAATIAAPFTVSTSYAIIYNYGLWRRHGRR